MGYCMTQRGCNFFMKHHDLPTALGALKALASKQRIAWVKHGEIEACKTLEGALCACGWDLTTNDGGDAVRLQFDREKIGDEATIFSAIAPWVQDGSFIEMQGEDGEVWRWVFEDGKCVEKMGRVVFH